VISAQNAASFAEAWYAAWNSHDLEAILSHYADDVEFSSPYVVALNGDPTGTLRGKKELRAYFARGLERFPDLRFEPLETFVGVDSITLTYVSVEGRRSAEVMTLDPDGRVVRVQAHYREARQH
jgi:ketosteroid isomerase-like protein